MYDAYETAYEEQPVMPTAAAPDGPPPVSVEDSIFGGEMYAAIVEAFSGSDAYETAYEEQSAPSSTPDKGTGIIDAGDSGGSWLTKALDYVRKDIFGFSDAKGANNDFPKLLATGAALAIGGAGKAYSENKRLAQEKEIADKRLLLESQKAGIIQSNQNFSNVKFKPPAGGLINTFKPAKITSLKDRIK